MEIKNKKMEMIRIIITSQTDFGAVPEAEVISGGEHLMHAYDRHTPSTRLLGRWFISLTLLHPDFHWCHFQWGCKS